jgi:hypothetical protein
VTFLKKVLIGVGIWVALAGLALWNLNGWPRTPLAWVVVLVAGPFVAILLEIISEAVGGFVSRRPPVRRLLDRTEEETATKRFAWKRIAVVLAVTLPLVVVMVLVGLLLTSLTPPVISSWWRHNFG